MTAKWHLFDPAKGYRQKRPPIKKDVLVLMESKGPGLPMGIAVGYRYDSAGQKQFPKFVVPGLYSPVVAWCDCLSDDFEFPLEIVQAAEAAEKAAA